MTSVQSLTRANIRQIRVFETTILPELISKGDCIAVRGDAFQLLLALFPYDVMGALGNDLLILERACEFEKYRDLQDALQRVFDQQRFQPLLDWLQGRRGPSLGTRTLPDPDPRKQSEMNAIIAAWNLPYHGDAAENLFKTCQLYMRESSTAQPRVLPFVQSTGTGKSRAARELSRFCMTLNVNIADPRDDRVYPPTDRAARDFLVECYKDFRHASIRDAEIRKSVRVHVQTFLRGLFECLTTALQDLYKEHTDSDMGYLDLAATLSRKMNEGGTYKEHNGFRKDFWDDVVDLADTSKAQHYAGIPDLPTGYYDVENNPLQTAARELVRWLEDHGASGPAPWLIITLDGSSTLTRNVGKHNDISLLSELENAMCDLHNLPIFIVVIGTVLQMYKPDPYSRHTPHADCPHTVVPFDIFTSEEKVPNNGSWRLERLASTRRLTHSGRALFGALYNAGDEHFQKNVASYACTKLLAYDPDRVLSGTQTLSALTVLLPLDFAPDNERERALIGRHMRLIISTNPETHTPLTISPSEPLLAEAARMAVERYSVDLPKALLSHLERPGVSAGTRGEVVSALILLLAINAARRPEDGPVSVSATDSHNDGLHRTVTVEEFLRALVPDKSIDDVLNLKPHDKQDREPLKSAFKDARIWLNHWARVEDQRVLQQKYLWGHLARGVGVICPIDTRSVDLVIPVLMRPEVRSSNIAPIIVRVESSWNATRSADMTFDWMDPFQIGIFDHETRGQVEVWPVLRLVMAPAVSKNEAGVVFRERSSEGTSPRGRGFSAYDIFFAGLLPQTYKVIQDNAVAEVYKDLFRLTGVCDLSTLDEAEMGQFPVWEGIVTARRAILEPWRLEGDAFDDTTP
ncbi:unnamed protein product [Peniophora sp. CBMAI 1063]|nr:unnamed protein product [Peniophora sp. CBMAI 1063]